MATFRQRLWQVSVSFSLLIMFVPWSCMADKDNETLETIPAYVSLNRIMLEQTNACRAFDYRSFVPNQDPYLQDNSEPIRDDIGSQATPWIGCSRASMPLIFKTLSALPNETTLSQLWIWDGLLPTIPAKFFAKVRPNRLIIDRCHTGMFTAADTFAPLGDSLTQLEIKNNVLRDINADILAPLRRLIKLDLSGNRVTQITNAAFGKSLPELRSLSLYRNQLSQIEDGALNNFAKLRSLNLANNRLTRITAATFRNLRSLEYLNLENNRITEIDENAFLHLTQLRVLNLGGNLLKNLNFPVVMPHLRQLYLHNNSFQSLDDIKTAQVPQPMPSLEALHLEQNQLKTLDGGLKRWPTLEILSLASNKLSALKANDFIGLDKLHTLALQGNFISRLGDETSTSPFTNLGKLNELFLSQNRLQELNDSVFNGLNELQILTVARNKLEKIDGKAFSGLRRLEKLFLNDNQLKHLDSGTLESVQSTLSLIDLSGNPWQCDCDTLWLTKWLSSRKTTSIIDPLETQCSSRNEYFGSAPLSDIASHLASFCGDGKGVQSSRSPYWEQDLSSTSNNVWITVLGIVLGVVSIIILLAVSYLYFQETTKGGNLWRVADGNGVTSNVFGRWTASGVMLRGEHALKRVPSDMVNLIPKYSNNWSSASSTVGEK